MRTHNIGDTCHRQSCSAFYHNHRHCQSKGCLPGRSALLTGRPFSTTRGACSTARRLLCFGGSNVDCELLSCTSSTVRSRLCSTTGRPGLTQKEITLPEEGQLKEPANIANSEMPSLMLVSVGHTAVSNYDSRARWLQQTAQWLIYGFLGFAK